MEPLEQFVADVRPLVADSLIALDFDGTLAPIVDDPSSSQLISGADAVVRALAAAGARIALVTGREAAVAARLSGLADLPGFTILGVYGAQRWQHGTVVSSARPDAVAAVARVRARLAELAAEREGLWVEDKTVSVVLQGRAAAPGVLDRLRPMVTSLARGAGLDVHPGRAVLEVRIPGFDKGSALHTLLREVRPAMTLYCGDDVGDVPAFDLVARRRRSGHAGWSVAVASDEVPDLARHADLSVTSPAELVALLHRLV